MTDTPRLGELIDPGARRDAVHIAIAPCIAAEELRPGQRVGFVRSGDTETVGPNGTPLGIVDPYLPAEVSKGSRFYVFLYPNTVTSLRHEWSHPAFCAAPVTSMADLAFSQKWLEVYAAKMNCYDTPARAYERLIEGLRKGDMHSHGSSLGGLYDLDDAEELREHGERVLGIKIDWGRFEFSCSC